MDDYFFETHVRSCKEVEEHTSFLEIFNFSVRLRQCSTVYKGGLD